MKKANEENQDFFRKVYELVNRIPFGKVTSYGAIGKVIGIRSSARMVGWAMNSAAGSDIPCHRVVNRNGELTGKMYFSTPTMMRELLESEGVKFIGDAVDMKKYFWEPEI